MTDFVKARELWAGLNRNERLKIVEALKADVELAANDFAGLPPQVQRGVIAGMPAEAPAEEHEPGGRKRRGE